MSLLEDWDDFLPQPEPGVGAIAMIHLTVNGFDVEVAEGSTILEAALSAEIRIPTLCKHPDLPTVGACGICVVKVEGFPNMVRACSTPVQEGMSVVTHDPELVSVRRTILELILSTHPNECLTCGRHGTCELQQLAKDFGIREEYLPSLRRELPRDDSTGCIILDPRKCIKCGRCVTVCQEVAGRVGALVPGAGSQHAHRAGGGHPTF